MLAGAGVFGLLGNDDLVLIQLLRQRKGSCQRGVAGGALFHTFQSSQSLGDVEDLALLDGHIAIHVTQGTGGRTGHVAVVGIGGIGHAEAGVGGGEGLAVELIVGSHGQAGQINRSGNDLGVAAGLAQAAGGAGQVAAAGVGANHHIGVLAKAVHKLMAQLPAQGLHAGDTEGGVQRGVEVAGIFQHQQSLIEQLGTHRQLQDFGAQSLALTGLFHDFGLAHALGVIALLDDDALQTLHGGLRGHGSAVVAGGSGHNALVAHLLGMVHRGGGAALLEGAGGVGGLVLDEDAGALAGSGALSGQRGQVVQLKNGGVAHVILLLDADMILQGIAGIGHQGFIIEDDAFFFVLAVIHADGVTDDLALAAGDGGVTSVHLAHASAPSNKTPLSCWSISRISGTYSP